MKDNYEEEILLMDNAMSIFVGSSIYDAWQTLKKVVLQNQGIGHDCRMDGEAKFSNTADAIESAMHDNGWQSKIISKLCNELREGK